MEKILIVRLGAMGDVLHALPAVAALGRALPGARIGWVLEERWAGLLAARGGESGAIRSPERPVVDTLHLVDTKAWRAAPFSDETWSGLRALFQELSASGYDAAIDFQGLVKSGLIAQWSGASVRVGFAHPKETAASLFYTRRVETVRAHVVERNFELAGALAAGPSPGTCDLLPRDAAAAAWCDQELRRRAIRKFALISPGAGWGAKIWPGELFGETARVLAEEGITPIVNIGPGEEDLAETVRVSSGNTAQTIQCAVGELIELTRHAQLFIGGDSGPLHLAAALRIPVVALFGPTDPARNGPYGTRSVVLRSPSSSTSYSHHAEVHEQFRNISPGEVVSAARSLLEQDRV